MTNDQRTSPEPLGLEAMRRALEEIDGMAVHLRQGGPDPMDLQELSDALERATSLANAALQLPETEIQSSDGGVEGHAERQVTDGLHSAGREKAKRTDERPSMGHHQVGAEVQIGPQSLKVTSAGIKPGPSDANSTAAPGLPSYDRRALQIMKLASELAEECRAALASQPVVRVDQK